MLVQALRSTVTFTVVALVAFAANSILCRLALGGNLIDPTSFTAMRLASGAAILLPWALSQKGARGSWQIPSAMALFVYALLFSLAYVTLGAGTGALLLFGLVQLTMLAVAFSRGERPAAVQVVGMGVAAGGVVWLVAPGVTAPDPRGAVFMALAGVAWGAYSLLGRGVANPAVATARNFILAAPLGLLFMVLFAGERHIEVLGALLAVVSGALTSGLGYVLWYSALRGHTRTSAAVVQLAVPIIAAWGGTIFLAEELTMRLVGAAVLTLGGVALAIRPAGERLTPSG